jgi:hypothetical protein
LNDPNSLKGDLADPTDKSSASHPCQPLPGVQDFGQAGVGELSAPVWHNLTVIRLFVLERSERNGGDEPRSFAEKFA